MIRRIPWWAYTTLAGFLMGVALFYSADAGAEPILAQYADSVAPVVCSELDITPTVQGVDAALDDIEAAQPQLTDRQVGEVIVLAVAHQCPRHLPLLQQYASGPAGAAA